MWQPNEGKVPLQQVTKEGVTRLILVSGCKSLDTSRILQKTNRLAHRQEGAVISYHEQDRRWW